MTVYAVMLFAASLVLILCGVSTARGSEDWVREGFRRSVPAEKKKDHLRALGIWMLAGSGVLLISGAVALLGESNTVVALSLGILGGGALILAAVFFFIQKKYNGRLR